ESYSDYLEQEKDEINMELPYKFYKELTLRRIEINTLQENVRCLEQKIMDKDTIISENELNIMQLNSKYKLMMDNFIGKFEISKRMKILLYEEIELLTEILKSYEEEQYLKTGHNERVQVIERLLIKYKKELEQAQSNYNQKLKDQYYSSGIDLHVDEILYRIEELQSIICNLKNENASLLKQTISLRRDNVYDPKDVKLIKLNENLSKSLLIDELKTENLTLQKHEAVLKNTIFAVKSENNQLLAKLKQLQKTNYTTQTIGYKIEIFDDNDVYLTLVEDDDDSDSDM
ncbi:1085_t:CDS:2, partial [Cetraspora pellucida]